jgi:membrane associated rhomboid family serine protease
MIPISDSSRRPLHVPIMTLLIILANAGVFLLELAGGNAFVNQWSVIPAHITAGQDWITVLTAMFMHAGWLHIIGNMVFLWAFGPQIEDLMGPVKFLVFYLLGGVAAMLAQVLIAPTSTVPNLGASGAIAAVMGAFLVTYPRDRIRTIIFLGWFIATEFIPALVLVGIWFLLQLFNQFLAVAAVQSGGVAYMAHIGGFLFGLLFNRLFETVSRRRSQGLPG